MLTPSPGWSQWRIARVKEARSPQSKWWKRIKKRNKIEMKKKMGGWWKHEIDITPLITIPSLFGLIFLTFHSLVIFRTPPSLISPVIVCGPENWKFVRRKLLAKVGKGTSPLAHIFIVYHQGIRHSVCVQGHALSSPFPPKFKFSHQQNDALC